MKSRQRTRGNRLTAADFARCLRTWWDPAIRTVRTDLFGHAAAPFSSLARAAKWIETEAARIALPAIPPDKQEELARLIEMAERLQRELRPYGLHLRIGQALWPGPFPYFQETGRGIRVNKVLARPGSKLHVILRAMGVGDETGTDEGHASPPPEGSAEQAYFTALVLTPLSPPLPWPWIRAPMMFARRASIRRVTLELGLYRPTRQEWADLITSINGIGQTVTVRDLDPSYEPPSPYAVRLRLLEQAAQLRAERPRSRREWEAIKEEVNRNLPPQARQARYPSWHAVRVDYRRRIGGRPS